LPVAWVPVLESFELALRASGARPKSVELHIYHLRHLAREIGVPVPWDITGDQLVAWAGAKNWQNETRRSYRQSFRKFWAWGVASERTAVNAAEDLPSVPASKPDPRPTPDNVYHEALAKAGPRERLMIRLSAEAGMRREEVAQAHSRDMFKEGDGWWLRVHGKGGKVRVVPLRDGLADELRALGRGYFFKGRYGIGHLSAAYVGKLVRRHLDEVNTMHKLRHRFGSRTYSVNRDVFVVQELLGHASADTTRRYVRVLHEDLRSTVETAAYD
jgi:integrase